METKPLQSTEDPVGLENPCNGDGGKGNWVFFLVGEVFFLTVLLSSRYSMFPFKIGPMAEYGTCTMAAL